VSALRAAALALSLAACARTAVSQRPTFLSRELPPARDVARPPPEPPPLDLTAPPLDLAVQSVTLPNGMRVVVSPMPSADRVAVVWVNRRAGYAAPDVPEGTARAFAEALSQRATAASAALPGASGPVSLAYRTHPSASLFWATVYPEELGTVLGSLAVAVRSFGRRDVAPLLAVREAPTLPALLPWEALRYEGSWDPRRAALGAATDRRATAGSLLALFQRLYTPAASSLVVTGPVDVAAVVAYAEHLLGPWRGAAPGLSPRRPFRLDPDDVSVWMIEREGSALVEVRARLPLRAPDARSVAAARVACTLLEYRAGSRLFTRLRDDGGLTYAFDTSCEHADGVSSFDVTMTLPAARVIPCVRELRASLASLATDPLRDDELAAARSLLVWRERRRLATTSERAFALAEAEGTEDHPGEAERAWVRSLRTLTAPAVSAYLAAEVQMSRALLFVAGSPSAGVDPHAVVAAFRGAAAGP
jgi:zinc protease